MQTGKSSKNFKVKLTILVTVLLFILAIILLNNVLKYNSINKLHKQYIEMVENKLNDLYKKKFEVELVKIGYRSKLFTLDGSSGCEYGENKNIEEYIFKIYSADDKVTSYATLWHDISDDNIAISEVNGSVSEEIDTSYKRHSLVRKVRQKVINELSSPRNKKYRLVETEQNENGTSIIYSIGSNIKDEYTDNESYYIDLFNRATVALQRATSDLDEDTELYFTISFEFKDANVIISKSGIEEVSDDYYDCDTVPNYIFSLSVMKILDKYYYENQYYIYINENSLIINLLNTPNKDHNGGLYGQKSMSYEEFKEQYTESKGMYDILFEKLQQLCIKNTEDNKNKIDHIRIEFYKKPEEKLNFINIDEKDGIIFNFEDTN